MDVDLPALRRAMGRRVRDRRHERGLTLEQVQAITGIRPECLSRIERGIVGTGDLMRIRIANALGSPVGELFVYELPELVNSATGDE